MPMKLFVSYNRTDQEAVNQIVAELRRHQHEVWTDQQLYAAEAWWSKILDRIEEADAVVVALSPAYLASEACTRERHYAATCRKPIAPVVVAPLPEVALPAELANIQRAPSPAALLAALRVLTPAAAVSSPGPERPAIPILPYVLLRDEICTKNLEMGRQFGIIGELHLFSRSSDPAEREAGGRLLDDVAKSPYLYAAPARLLTELTERVERTAPPWTAILGAALGGIGFTNLLIVIGIYRIVPKPWDFVTPNVALALLGAVLCCFALRRHLPSASIGLSVCFVSIAAAAINMLKYFHKI
jgi:TIR domain